MHKGLLIDTKFVVFVFSVRDGQIVVSYNLESGPTSIAAPNNILDGNLHEILIRIQRKDKLIPSSGLSLTPDWECTIKVDESAEMPQSNEIEVIFQYFFNKLFNCNQLVIIFSY